LNMEEYQIDGHADALPILRLGEENFIVFVDFLLIRTTDNYINPVIV